GIDPSENDLIIKRSFSSSAGTRQFINGSPTTLSILKNLGDDLVDLHGPHDHQSLLSPETQLSLLDSFARAEEQLDEYRKHYRQLQTLLAEHTALNTAETARSLLTYAEKLDLDPEQLAALEQRVSLFETLKRKYVVSIAEVIAFGERAAEGMREIEGRDAELERLAKEIQNVRAQMNQAG